MQYFHLEALRIVDLDARVAPFYNFCILIRKHFGELVEKLCDRMVLLASAAALSAVIRVEFMLYVVVAVAVRSGVVRRGLQRRRWGGMAKVI
jgi:hypothetical protein